MKLYYSPVGNGSASFIAANCFGYSIACEAIDVQVPNPRTLDGTEFSKIIKSSTLPCLVFSDDSVVLSEEPTILSFIADQSHGKIAPQAATLSRYRVDQFIVTVSTNINVTIDELLVPSLTEETRMVFRQHLNTALQVLDRDFEDNRTVAVGGAFSIADIYLYCVLRRLDSVGVELRTIPLATLNRYFEAIRDREDVTSAVARMSSAPARTALVEVANPKCAWLC